MKPLLTALSVLIISAVSAYAEEITMSCKRVSPEIWSYEDRIRSVKYVDPITGPTQILYRIEGRWDEWGNNDNNKYLSIDVKISERGGILTGKRQGNAWDIPPANVIEGHNYIGHNRIILDFEFITRIQEIYFTHPGGNPTTSKDEGWHPENPKIVNWSCEIHS
jgi:hypothetical protein